LLVSGSGDLTLDSSTLRFNSSADGEFGIEVNGTLYVLGSTIESASTNAYTFVSNPGANLEIHDSFIHDCGYMYDVGGQIDFKKGSVYIGSDGSNITNTTFSQNFIALGLYSNNNEVSNNRIISNEGAIGGDTSGSVITGNIIKSNLIFAYIIYGENIRFEHNVLDTTMTAVFAWNDSVINNNTFFNITGIGLQVLGNSNNITSNNIMSTQEAGSGQSFGVVVSGFVSYSENTNIVGNTILQNGDYGLYLAKTKNTLLKDNLIDSHDQYDVYTLSSESTTLDNTTYTSLLKGWYLDLSVVDDESSPVPGASVVIKDKFTATVFSGSTDSQGEIYEILNETIENVSGVFDYNPFTINVTKSGYFGNVTSVNVTGDLLVSMSIEEEPAGNVTSIIITVTSPLNNSVYLRPDLINYTFIRLEVETSVNVSYCEYMTDSSVGSLTEISPDSFRKYFNVSGFDEGSYTATFLCGDGTNESTTKVFFSLYPERDCLSDGDCAGDEECSDWECEELSCSCGYASNHECVYYECCSDNACEDTEFCDTGDHTCENVQCDCGVVRSHQCVFPYSDYCCYNTHCEDNQSCDVINNKCVTQILYVYLPESITQGEKIKVYVRDQNNDTVPGATVTLTYSDSGNIYLFSTDTQGMAEIPINESGNTQISARKQNYFTGSESFEVTPGFDWLLFSMIFVVIAVAILVPVLLFKKRKLFKLGRFMGPISLEKTTSGRIAMLRIKNKSGNVLRLLNVVDHVPRGGFMKCNITPEIRTIDQNTDRLKWTILQMKPKEEVVIEYQASGFFRGFSVEFGGKVYES